ncbi:alpha/beta fold hydrolase [Dactylosporangium sp. NPDC051541]|uniref:alpha/beta fold hydrolase n=1 Tax=Dactylosporangium sp. NPDC051541 TaxID=3363977 RepID=UPI00378A823B
MPYVFTNGIRLSFERHGRGERVLFIMGSSAGGRVWTMHQTPAVVAAGYQAITFDNRGIPPSDAPPGRYSLDDVVADTKGLIEAIGAAPCRIVGTSMGALIAQELAIRWPELVRCAVLISTKSRSDPARLAHSAASRALAESGVRLPAEFRAGVAAFQMLSPATLNDPVAAAGWLDTLRHAAATEPAGYAGGQDWVDLTVDRRDALRGVAAPCRVIAFADDLVTPPHLGAEVAAAIPDCDLIEVAGAGHFGYLERPAEVNSAILEFLAKHEDIA